MNDANDHRRDLEDHDRGLVADLPALLLQRRRFLQLFAVAGAATLVGCGNDGDADGSSTAGPSNSTTAPSATTTPAGSTTTIAATDAATTTVGSTVATTTGGSCAVIPEETAGPYPGDGTNGPDALAESGIVRSDIRSSFGSSTTVAEGVALTINLTLVDTTNGCQPLTDAAVYLWHCDRDGRYSMYSDGVTDENYLRGVQGTDSNGRVSFQTIFPACYSGRWPHAHFEVYADIDAATNDGTRYATSQLALPEDVCNTVFATSGYEQSVTNLARVSLASDGVFGDDGGVNQLGTVTGSVDSGFVAELVVPVDPTAVSSGGAGMGGGQGGPPPQP